MHHGGVVVVCGLRGRCGLYVVAMVVVGCMWTAYGLCMVVVEAMGEVWDDCFQSQYQADGCT